MIPEGRGDNKYIKGDLKGEVWEQELDKNNAEDELLLNGIKNGFKIINMDKKVSSVQTKNYKSAIDNRIAVEDQILKEIEGGRYVVVQTPPTIISGLGAIPKDDGSIRIIHDCSRPEENAVNDYANLDKKN